MQHTLNIMVIGQGMNVRDQLIQKVQTRMINETQLTQMTTNEEREN